MPDFSNSRIAKNAIALTMRMILVTIVGLYTSRIVLEVLGIDNYGIYGVIGGVVGIASFLNTSMAGASSRFISFELGRNTVGNLKRIFSSALIIHLIIAFIVIVLAETVGLWFVNNKMNFPPDRMFTVNILFQFTIISMVVNFTQVPYTAAIIAHEKMSIYAYLEIVNVVLKLIIVYVLLIVRADRLILYGALMLTVNVIIAFTYRFYCVNAFHETRIEWVWDKKVMKEMLSFSGYDLYGNMCAVVKTQGQPLLLNIFFGVVANAGASIAMAVSGAVNGFTSAVMQAFRPQIIKQYSGGDFVIAERAARKAIQFTLFTYTLVALPIIIEAPKILSLWLGQIPQYSIDFVRLILLTHLFSIFVIVNNTCIHATGDIKRISFISGTCYLISLALAYLLLRKGAQATVIYIIDLLMMAIVVVLGWIFIKKQIYEFKIGKYISSTVRSFISFICALVISYIFCYLLFNGLFIKSDEVNNGYSLIEVGISIIVCSVFSLTSFCVITFNRNERRYLFSNIKNQTTKVIKFIHSLKR